MTCVVRCPHEDDDEDDDAFSSQSRCCCHYDPFEDDSPESRIKDLSFALKKLSVMKCQMRKWRVERLELESRVRTMNKCLRANGVNVDVAMKVDPLVTHLRVENQKLENRKAALEDEVRDLKETLKERECFEDEPCKAVIYAREKMLEVRARCATEKRQLRETMASLQLKLEEASERLANEVDQQQVSKKSIGELCAQLKKENKRLLDEVETLKKCATAARPNTAEMAELCERVRACECEATQMRRQIAERDAVIQDLEKRLQAQRRNSTQLEKVAVSQRALGDQKCAKQKQKDEKHSTQLNALKVELEKVRANNRKLEETSKELGNENAELRETKTRLEDELAKLAAKLQRSSDELRYAKENECRAKSELERLQNEAKTRQDELASRIREIEEKAEMLKKTRGELDCCRCKLEEMRRKLEESRIDMESAETRNNELQCSLDECTFANDKLTTELERTKTELGKQLDDTKRLRDELKAVQCELDRLKNTYTAILAENTCLKKDNHELKKSVETLKQAKETLAADLVNAKIEMQSEKQRFATEARRQSADTENELKSCRAENKRLKCAVSECKKKARTEMSCVSKALKEEMHAQIQAVNYVAELMNYAEGRLTKLPETSPTISDNGRSGKWSAPEIIQLFDNSRLLTEEISKAEVVARNLEPRTKDETTVKKQGEKGGKMGSNETGTSMESTTKAQFTAKSNDVPRQVFPCAVSPIVLSPEKQLRKKQSPERERVATFDPASWLKSLSLTKLAELHEQICDATSNIVSDDGAKLQRQIARRQREVTARATETQMALLKEQMRLDEIANAMHRESRIALHISVDARMQPSASGDRPGAVVCCMREDCLRLGCAVDFDPVCRK